MHFNAGHPNWHTSGIFNSEKVNRLSCIMQGNIDTKGTPRKTNGMTGIISKMHPPMIKNDDRKQVKVDTMP